MRSSRWSVVAVVVLVGMIGFTASGQTYGGTLRAAIAADGLRLDPHKVVDAPSMWYLNNIYDTLVMFDDNLDIHPALAESWDFSEDGKVITFYLRSDVTFHSGRPLTAQDVKYSFERILDPETGSPARSDFLSVKEILIPDQYTVELVMDQPFAPILAKLASVQTAIVNPELSDDELDANPDGTGPFMFKSWVKDEQFVIERNPNYWNPELPYLDEIIFTVIPDETVKLVSMRTGAIEYMDSLPPKDVERMKEAGEFEVLEKPSTQWYHISFNCAREPFTSKKVRQAFAWVVNRDVMLRIGLSDQGSVLNTGPIPDWNWAAVPMDEWVYPSLDIDRAKQLLADAGYADGFKVTLIASPEDIESLKAAQVLQEQVRPLGVEITIEQLEWGPFIDRFVSSDFDMVACGWIGAVDPDDFLYRQFHSGGDYNWIGFSNPAVDALLERGRATMDQGDRRTIYVAVQKMIAEEAPNIFTFIRAQIEGVAHHVQGYRVMPTAQMIYLRYAWKVEE